MISLLQWQIHLKFCQSYTFKIHPEFYKFSLFPLPTSLPKTPLSIAWIIAIASQWICQLQTMPLPPHSLKLNAVPRIIPLKLSHIILFLFSNTTMNYHARLKVRVLNILFLWVVCIFVYCYGRFIFTVRWHSIIKK